MENYCDGPLKKSPKTTPILPNNVKVSALGQNNDDNLPKNYTHAGQISGQPINLVV